MTLCQRDREVIEIWCKYGIPDDRSTLEAAVEIMRKLQGEVDEWQAIVGQLGGCARRGCKAPPTRAVWTAIGLLGPPLEVQACEQHANDLWETGWQIVLTPAEAARALGQTAGDSTDG